mgnify:FL=1
MGMTKMIEIDGKQVPFKASAAIPRIYRIKFHRDIYKDLDGLGKAVGNGDEGSSHLDMFSLEMFENIAYIMAKHADPPSRTARRNGLMSSAPSPSTRCFRRLSSCGD